MHILKVWRHFKWDQKSDSFNRCVFTWTAVVPNFIPTRFETTEPWAFLMSVVPMWSCEQRQGEYRYEIRSWYKKSEGRPKSQTAKFCVIYLTVILQSYSMLRIVCLQHTACFDWAVLIGQSSTQRTRKKVTGALWNAVQNVQQALSQNIALKLNHVSQKIGKLNIYPSDRNINPSGSDLF